MASALIKCGQVSVHASAWTVGNMACTIIWSRLTCCLHLFAQKQETTSNAVLNTEHVYQDIHSQMQIHF